MSDRHFVPDLDRTNWEYQLDGADAHHLAVVCRKLRGARVELFNGQGLRAFAQIVFVARKRVSLAVEAFDMRPKDFLELSVAVALPKGDRGQWLVEKCTELGVRSLIPLSTSRSIAECGTGRLEKLRRTVIEACKQCGRNWLMEVTTPIALDAYLANSPPGWLMDPGGVPIAKPGDEIPTTVAIGPEGGWTAEERASAEDRHWKVVSMCDATLRVETAAVAIAAWVRLRS